MMQCLLYSSFTVGHRVRKLCVQTFSMLETLNVMHLNPSLDFGGLWGDLCFQSFFYQLDFVYIGSQIA
jgi:hypothetical protein